MPDDSNLMEISRSVARRVIVMFFIEPEIEAQRKKDQGLMEMLERTLSISTTYKTQQHIKQTEERVRTTDELLERNAAKGTKACDT